jgi:DMSO/TMAO reductase YedYZ heme-binding membrane subunit
MRYPAMFAALITPASALAHNGPHDGMEPVDHIVHLLGQHYAPVLLVMLIAALLLVTVLRTRRENRTPLYTGIDRDKRQR